MAGELHEVSLAIGRLEAAVGGLRDDHRDVRAAVEQVDQRLANIESIKKTVDRIEPLVDQHEAATQRAAGRAGLIGAGAGGIIALVTEFVKTKLGM